jgi:hypothetical protein
MDEESTALRIRWMVGSCSFTMLFYRGPMNLIRRPLLTVETTDLPSAYGITRPMTTRSGLGSSPDSPVLQRFGRRPLRISLKK